MKDCCFFCFFCFVCLSVKEKRERERERNREKRRRRLLLYLFCGFDWLRVRVSLYAFFFFLFCVACAFFCEATFVRVLHVLLIVLLAWLTSFEWNRLILHSNKAAHTGISKKQKVYVKKECDNARQIMYGFSHLHLFLHFFEVKSTFTPHKYCSRTIIKGSQYFLVFQHPFQVRKSEKK